jgi:hypothetical protein
VVRLVSAAIKVPQVNTARMRERGRDRLGCTPLPYRVS